MKHPDWKLLYGLGLPSLGITFGVTVLSAFLPTVLHGLANPIVVGLVIGAEGLFGLFMPIIMGALVDRVKKVHDRLRYLVPATIAMAVALALMGVFDNLAFIAVMVGLFYVGYYAYLAPYWALYPDLIPKKFSGRSRSAESVWRVMGSLTALVSGGFLITLWQPLPFIVGACLVVGATMWLGWYVGTLPDKAVRHQRKRLSESFRSQWDLLYHNAPIRNLAIANALWNAALRSILAFVVLFFTIGLGRSHGFVSGFVFPVAAIGIGIMAPLSGKLADRYGHVRVLAIASLVYGIGDLLPGITQESWVFACVPLVAAAAATVMTLPYAALMRLLNGETHGEVSGLFGFSRGVGSFAGPLLAGLAVELGRGFFASTQGYAAFWLATGAYVLISLFFLWRLDVTSPRSV
ncbi:MAG TPA: MFS transporter [Candidatus Saccharimonadales bacterium]|nr:MFS transporter [Candidatus Saccharimonadales bacterium]